MWYAIIVSQNVLEENVFRRPDIGPGTPDHPGAGHGIEKICSHKSWERRLASVHLPNGGI